MRMRKKPNLENRMQRSGAALISRPEELRGRWLEEHPGCSSLAVELGCGKGRFTVDTAQALPGQFIAAVERVPEAIVVGMERAVQRGVENVGFVDMDVTELWRVFAPGEADRIYVNFCDPWPSNGHAHRRLTAPDFLTLYRTVLKPGGQLHFKTDNVPLFDWSVQQLERCGWTLELVTHDLHKDGVREIMTDYEAKFHAQGIPICKCVASRPAAEELPMVIIEQRPGTALRLPDPPRVRTAAHDRLLNEMMQAIAAGDAVNVVPLAEDMSVQADDMYTVIIPRRSDEEQKWLDGMLADGAWEQAIPGARYGVFQLGRYEWLEKWDELLEAIAARGYALQGGKPILLTAGAGMAAQGRCQVWIPVRNDE